MTTAGDDRAGDGAGRLRDVLLATRSVALVGASADRSRPSNDVFGYLVAHTGYTVYPVNPNVAEVHGIRAYPSLAALPEVPDMVNVFRRRGELASVLAETLALRPLPATLWLQLGLRDDAVAASAARAGLTVVMDRCLKVDHARLIGS